MVKSNTFVDEVKQTEKEVKEIETVGNVEKTEEIREHLNQFYREICTSVQAGTSRPFFTTNVRLNIAGKRVSSSTILISALYLKKKQQKMICYKQKYCYSLTSESINQIEKNVYRIEVIHNFWC